MRSTETDSWCPYCGTVLSHQRFEMPDRVLMDHFSRVHRVLMDHFSHGCPGRPNVQVRADINGLYIVE